MLIEKANWRLKSLSDSKITISHEIPSIINSTHVCHLSSSMSEVCFMRPAKRQNDKMFRICFVSFVIPTIMDRQSTTVTNLPTLFSNRNLAANSLRTRQHIAAFRPILATRLAAFPLLCFYRCFGPFRVGAPMGSLAAQPRETRVPAP